MHSKAAIYLLAAASALALTAGPAQAEIVLLSSGRTLDVASHRFDGNFIVLTMRDNGQVTFDRSLVEKVVPDEVPYEPPQPPAAATPVQEPPAKRLAPGPYVDLIASMAQAHGVDPVLVQALIEVESGYRPRARSHKGAMGLMQLMPATARQYNVRNPYDPQANIAAGVKHLKSLLDRLGGSVELALAAYNAGEAAVKRFNGIPPYRETRTYVSRILALAGIK